MKNYPAGKEVILREVTSYLILNGSHIDRQIKVNAHLWPRTKSADFDSLQIAASVVS